MIDEAQQFENSVTKISERVSANTDCTENDEKEEDLQNRYTVVESEAFRFYRVNLFAQNCSKKPSSKLNRSAVGWIQTNCFIKGYDLEVASLAVTLYYVYTSNLPIDKSRLELLRICFNLCSCNHFVCRPEVLWPEIDDRSLSLLTGIRKFYIRPSIRN